MNQINQTSIQIYRYYLMGTCKTGTACMSDPLAYISQMYGEDVCKYIVSIKSEEFIEEVTPKLVKKVQQHIGRTSNSLEMELDKKEQKIRKIFDNILTQALKQSRVALEGVKKREKKNQQEIFGLTRIQDKFIKLKINKDQIIQQHQYFVLRLLQEKKAQLKAEIQSKRPELPDLSQLPFWLRDQAIVDAEIRYDHEIKLRQEEIQTILESSIFFDNLEDTMRKTVGIQQANDLVHAAEAAFQRIRRNLTFSDNPKSCFV